MIFANTDRLSTPIAENGYRIAKTTLKYGAWVIVITSLFDACAHFSPMTWRRWIIAARPSFEKWPSKYWSACCISQKRRRQKTRHPYHVNHLTQCSDGLHYNCQNGKKKKEIKTTSEKSDSHDLEKWFPYVGVRHLFYQPMDEKIKTWPLHFPAK